MVVSTICASIADNSFVATTHASRAGEVERNQSNLVAHFRDTEHLGIQIKIVFVKARTSSKTNRGSNCCRANFLCYNDPFQNEEQKLAKKSKKKITRSEYSK